MTKRQRQLLQWGMQKDDTGLHVYDARIVALYPDDHERIADIEQLDAQGYIHAYATPFRFITTEYGKAALTESDTP